MCGAGLGIVALFFLPAPTPAEAARLGPAVRQLASPRYAVRQAAARTLVELGPVAKPALVRAAGSADAEVVHLAQTALLAIADGELEALAPFPEIDAAWFNVKTREYDAPVPALEAYLDAVGKDGYPFANYRRACRWAVRDLLAAGLPAGYLRLWLADLHEKDAVFYAGITSGRHWLRPPDWYDAAAYRRNWK
jgi:hypothetical protein